MPEISTQDQIEIDALCSGHTLKQEVAHRIIETCELGYAGISEGFVEGMNRQLEAVFIYNGENHAEQT